MRILMLGGTGFIGPHFVDAALARGHEVAVFNRGERGVELPEGVEWLTGDRDGDLSAIEGRDWDAVFDLPTMSPRWVRKAGEALAGRVGHYTFISTLNVYADPYASTDIGEDAPVHRYTGEEDPYEVRSVEDRFTFGALKALAEREAREQFPDRALVLRLGHIVGPGDWENSFTYLLERIARGGEMLVAGDPALPMQLIDVRDIAAFALELAERRATGTYNVTGQPSLTFEQLLATAGAGDGAGAIPTWAPSSFFAAQPDREHWGRLLFWTAEDEGWASIMRMSVARALDAGLTTRPLEETLADTLEWHRSLPPERRAELLPGGEAGGDEVELAWARYLEREQELLAQWRRRGPEDAAGGS